VDPGPRKVGRRRIGGEGSGCTAHLASKSPTKKKKKRIEEKIKKGRKKWGRRESSSLLSYSPQNEETEAPHRIVFGEEREERTL
jgi:hypothetical protein